MLGPSPACAVIFDVGNVLCRAHVKLTLGYFKENFGITENIIARPEVAQLGRGQLDIASAYKLFAADHPTISKAQFLEGINMMIIPEFDQHMVALIEDLKRDTQCQLIILSDTIEPHWNLISAKNADTLAHFGDRIFLSFKTGRRKPDGARTFGHLLRCTGMQASQCVFIDDSDICCQKALAADIAAVFQFDINQDDPTSLATQVKEARASIKRSQLDVPASSSSLDPNSHGSTLTL